MTRLRVSSGIFLTFGGNSLFEVYGIGHSPPFAGAVLAAVRIATPGGGRFNDDS